MNFRKVKAYNKKLSNQNGRYNNSKKWRDSIKWAEIQHQIKNYIPGKKWWAIIMKEHNV